MPKWTEEQQLAIDKENSNIIVSAGAGSGKTAVLTARVIRKLKNNVNINELLILTFTKKAAYEMKERIRKAILKDDSLHDQLNYIDSSYITTFDSFALSIVKKYNYLLNISKNVKIADASIIYLEKKKILDDIFNNLYEEKNANFLKIIDDFTVKDDKDIKKYILDINDKLDLKYNKNDYLSSYITNYYSVSNLNTLEEQYLQLINYKIKKIDSLLTDFSNFVDQDYFMEVNEAFSNLLNSTTYDEIRKNIAVKFPNLPRGSSLEAKNIKKDISDLLLKIDNLVRFDSRDELLETFKSTEIYVYAIIDIIKKLDVRIEEFKNKNNIYEFTDISKMAIKIVKENEEVREELKNFFKEIMIDEYQDTSDLQEEFITMIDNNNIYMVGDIKQSIYRFRNANPYLFKNKYDNYSKNNGGFKIDLTRNFRSRLEVIDNINLFFSLIMSDELGGADYKKSHRMIFGNSSYIEEGSTNQNNNIEILNYEYDKSLGYTKEEIEIFFIANDIKEKVRNKYQIFDKDEKVLRDACYSDFAILLDKSTNFDLYKKIFEYMEVPIIKHTTTNITNEVEIALIKNILKLIISAKDKKYDTEFKYAFISLARSYLFSYNDNDIFNYFLNQNYDNSSIMMIVNEIASKMDFLTLGDLIILIIDKFSFYMKQIEVADVKNRMNRLSAIIDIFNNLAEIGYSIYDCYSYFDTIIEEDYKLEVKELDAMTDSVKIMTIHASKGLEFPICYFASLHSEFNIRELNEKFLYNNKYGIITPYFKEGIGKTFVKDLVKEEYVREEISEKIRLFYVALTRAKEKMIMITSYNNDDCKNRDLENCRSFLDMLSFIKEDIFNYIKDIDIKNIPVTKDYNSIKKYNYKDNISRSDKKIKIGKVDVQSGILEKQRISKANTELVDSVTKDSIEFGKELHRILECIDFKHPDIDSLNLSFFYKDKIKKFIKLINDEDILNVYKEHEFIFYDNGIYKHGIIDLILEYKDHVKVIDYKLKNIKDESYFKQIETYKAYVSTKINKKIVAYLFSIIDGKLEIIE